MGKLKDVIIAVFILVFCFCNCKGKEADKNILINSCETYVQLCNESDKSPFIDFCNKTISYFDYETALNIAKSENKQLLIYFNSIACVNCRKFEERIFFESKVKDMLSDNVLLVVLFIDLRCPLPNDKIAISKINGKKLRTFGAYNSELQVALAKSGHQPYFSIIDTSENLISSYKGVLDSIDDFHNWIKANYSN